MIPVMTVLAATVPRFAAALLHSYAVIWRILEPFVEDSLECPVVPVSSAWTRLETVVTINAMEGTAAESVSQI
jgi:hypothetical protein